MSLEDSHQDDEDMAADFERHEGETPLLPQDERSAPPPDSRLSIPRLLALTCINGGLQVFFSTVMANLSPYLQKLGLAKSTAAAIVICLPLSGAFIGPISGAVSDRLRTRWGRRRPILVAGAISTAACLVLLAWTEQFVKAIAGCQNSSCGPAAGRSIVTLAVLWTLLMSISVQPVQAGVRSLMVDVAPADQQDQAASWAGRIQGVSAIFSFFASSLELTKLPGLGHLTQFQALACLNFITLGSTVAITCVFIHEKESRRIELDAKESVMTVLRRIFETVKKLRGKLRRTCETQFSSWFAWFPFLYYNTTYIGELATPSMAAKNNDTLAQAGSLASLNFAIVAFVMITVLPLALPYLGRILKRNQTHEPELANSLPNLIWLWVATQPILGVLLVLTLAAAYQWQGIVLVALAGIPWAVTNWVPFAIVGSETSRLGLTGDEDADSESGAIMGVHNMAISLPQVLSGLVSSLIYGIAEGAGSKVPTAWVFAFSAIAAFMASLLARRMA